MLEEEQTLPKSAAEPAGERPLPPEVPQEGSPKQSVPSDHVPRTFAFLSMFVFPVVYCIASILIARAMRQIKKECQSGECQTASHYISTSVAGQISPCNDFYQYTCQNWKVNYAEHLTAEVTLSNLSDYFNGTGVNTENFEKATNTYASCTASFASAKDQSIAHILNFVNGNLNLDWPNEPTNIGITQLYEVIIKLQLRYNIYPFFTLHFNDGLEKLTISAAGRYHPWYMRHPNTAKPTFRRDLIAQIIGATNLTVNPAVVGNIISIEDAISDISTTDEAHLLSKIKVLAQDQFQFSWNLMNAIRDYLPQAQKRIFIGKTLAHWNQVDALRKSFALLNDQGNVSAVANYIAWAVIEVLGRRTSRSVRQIMVAVCSQHNVVNVAEPSLGHNVCYYQTYQLFALVLDRQMYLRMDLSVIAFFNDAMKTVKLFAKGLLEELFWMDKETVKRLQKQVDIITTDVGIIKRFRYVDVEDAYDHLTFIDQNEVFTKNYLDITSKLNDRLIDKNFRYTYAPSLWSIHPQARYVAAYWTFYIPLSLLRKPLFVMGDFPLAIIYGSLISQVVMELFMEGYRNRKLLAWSFATAQQFKIYMDCYNNGYSNATFALEDPPMAYFRSTALTKTFQMYRLEAHKRGKSYRLPNSNLTAQQLFFVAACLHMCTRNQAEEGEKAALCNLPLRRVRAFSKAFACSRSHHLGMLRLNCSQFKIIDELFAFKFEHVIETSLSVQGDEKGD
ncbi:unnamed protein product [Ixodes persulcatus]